MLKAKIITHKFKDKEEEICLTIIKNPCNKSLEDFPKQVNRNYFCINNNKS